MPVVQMDVLYMKGSLKMCVSRWAVLTLFASFAGCCDDGVKVSSFGYDPEDSTEIIQRAIDSGAPKIVFDRQLGPWVARPLVGRSNIEIVFEDGVELVAKRGEFHGIRDYLLRFECVSNVVIRGLGDRGGTLRMWKSDYLDPKQKYAKSEWRYALRLCGVENVLVENMSFRSSGGDGIVVGAKGKVNSRNVTIRKCVCDDNHRQGISICSGDGVLIEDTVLSNTKGTPPEAGIDLEPDHDGEVIGVTLRNVISKNNAGNGFEMYLVKLRDYSKPVMVRMENCKSIGNRIGVSVCADNRNDSGAVKGLTEFIGCEFAESRQDAISIVGTPSAAMDVVFRDCIISNATRDVSVSAGSSRQGPPDGITFDNLTIYQPTARPWFSTGRQSFGPLATNVSGKVTIVTTDGKRETVKIDRSWVEKNLPAVDGGRMPAPRVAFPCGQQIAVVDSKPDELVELSPVALVYGGHYVLYVPKAGVVRLAAHQIDITGKRPETTKKSHIFQLLQDGKNGRRWEVDTPGFAGGEISFNAPKPGFYGLTLPNGGTRLVLDRSSVPVGIDVRRKEHIVAGIRGKSGRLWFWAPGDRTVSFCVAGDSYNRFSVRLTDPAGKEVAHQELVEGLCSMDVAAEKKNAGLWRVDFAPAKRPAYDWVRVDLSGVPGILFLSDEKYWK